jgi:hypothetical protein
MEGMPSGKGSHVRAALIAGVCPLSCCCKGRWSDRAATPSRSSNSAVCCRTISHLTVLIDNQYVPTQQKPCASTSVLLVSCIPSSALMPASAVNPELVPHSHAWLKLGSPGANTNQALEKSNLERVRGGGDTLLVEKKHENTTTVSVTVRPTTLSGNSWFAVPAGQIQEPFETFHDRLVMETHGLLLGKGGRASLLAWLTSSRNRGGMPIEAADGTQTH